MKRLIALLALVPIILTACGEPPVSTREPKGNPNAAVRIEEFSDLQCPACRTVHAGVVVPLIQKHGNNIRYDFKHFPLRASHRYALDAGEFAECAADQGKFWEFVDIAFEKQNEMSFDAFLEWAEEIDLKVKDAERCWKSHSKRGVVLADYKEGRNRGVEGTPTFFVNGQQVGSDQLEQAIEAATKDSFMRL